MTTDLQKADLSKRISAWLFDGMLLIILVSGCCALLSALLNYEGHINVLSDAYARYEERYSTTFDISQEEYEAMAAEQRENYDAAYKALTSDDDAMYAYNMSINLTVLIASIGILIAVLILEFVIPLWLKNGQTLGKKIFGLGVMRVDSVMLTPLQLFVRTLLGKYVIELMIPVFVVIMLLLGITGLEGTIIGGGVILAQVICLLFTRERRTVHDLLAGTVVVDISSQRIFRTSQELLDYTKKVHAERAARQDY